MTPAQPCPRCLVEGLDADALRGEIERYAAAIPAEQCVPEEEYRRRLAACENCPSLQSGICRFCGCFVLVRARRRVTGCPDPAGSRWD